MKTYISMLTTCGIVTVVDIVCTLMYSDVMVCCDMAGEWIGGGEQNPIMRQLIMLCGPVGSMIIRGLVSVFCIAILFTLYKMNKRNTGWALTLVWTTQQTILLARLLS